MNESEVRRIANEEAYKIAPPGCLFFPLTVLVFVCLFLYKDNCETKRRLDAIEKQHAGQR